LKKQLCGLDSTQFFFNCLDSQMQIKTQKRERNFVYEYNEDFLGEYQNILPVKGGEDA